MTPRLLIRGATLVTADPSLGDLAADILIEGTQIAAIGPDLAAEGAEQLDATGCIVAPGFVNAHMHTWQTGLRGLAADWTLLRYFRAVHAGLATMFTPEDIGIATLLGAREQIDCGTTTLVDWCHANRTPAHTDAAVAALIQSGIRAAFFHGSPKPDPRPGEPHFSEIPHPRAEVERLLSGPLADRDGLVTLGLAILGPHYSTMEVARADFRLAREHGLIASMHQGGGPAQTPGGWENLLDEGLVDASINIVHGNDLSDTLLDRLVAAGVTFSIAPEGEATQGHGYPITNRLRARGTEPSIGVDLPSIGSADMPSQARIALALARAQHNAATREATGAIPETSAATVRDALGWSTLEGARALGMADRIGSLTPGKQADLIVLRPGLSQRPVLDPVACLMLHSTPAQIEHVLIAGRYVKQNGQLIAPDLDTELAALEASGHRIARGLDAAMPAGKEPHNAG